VDILQLVSMKYVVGSILVLARSCSRTCWSTVWWSVDYFALFWNIHHMPFAHSAQLASSFCLCGIKMQLLWMFS